MAAAHDEGETMADRSALYWDVYQRLLDDTELDDRVRALIEAAFDGPSVVRDALDAAEVASARTPVPPEARKTPARAFLRRLEIEGFRGIGPKTTFEIPPGPGLTLVVGRNGSGKSSLAEGLEILLTGESLRWANRRQKEWAGGFRNLHQPDPTYVAAEFHVDGSGQTVQLRRSWKKDQEAPEGAIKVLSSAHDDASFESLGWNDALTTFRPILSYNELGKALDEGPSHLFDLLRGVLGMDEMSGAEQALAAVRKQLEPTRKAAKDGRARLEQTLEGLPDEPRAAQALAVLAKNKRKPDLEALREIALGAADEDAGRVAELRALTALRVPEVDAVLAAASALREAAKRHRELGVAAAGLQSETAELLERALRWQQREAGARCPVCESDDVLDEAWRTRTTERLAALKESSSEVAAAVSAEKGAIDAVKRLLRSVSAPRELDLSAMEAARAAHAAWLAAPDDPAELAEHLESAYDELAAVYPKLAAEAADELRRVQAEWQPARRALEAWIEQAEAADKAAVEIKALKAAETWVKAMDQTLRSERFTPIRERAQQIWEALRHQSNVAIKDIRLEGSKTHRRVELDVVVDGMQALALGVMSQGELHAMLLSLFLPRLTLDESPFGFLVVDDPVQAMDPAKVDGLARVLHEVAQKRQVIVLTHDARLPEAIRRLQLDATVYEVARQRDSVVELRKTKDPADQLIADAREVVRERETMGAKLVGRVVPGLCRTALEVRFKQLAWSRLLGQGGAHAAIEEQIRGAQGLHNLATLALIGDTQRGGELFGKLNNICGKEQCDTFKELKTLAHQAYGGDALGLVERSQRLLDRLPS
jgi:recombinational DNA repair ATPase RecF